MCLPTKVHSGLLVSKQVVDWFITIKSTHTGCIMDDFQYFPFAKSEFIIAKRSVGRDSPFLLLILVFWGILQTTSTCFGENLPGVTIPKTKMKFQYFWMVRQFPAFSQNNDLRQTPDPVDKLRFQFYCMFLTILTNFIFPIKLVPTHGAAHFRIPKCQTVKGELMLTV